MTKHAIPRQPGFSPERAADHDRGSQPKHAPVRVERAERHEGVATPRHQSAEIKRADRGQPRPKRRRRRRAASEQTSAPVAIRLATIDDNGDVIDGNGSPVTAGGSISKQAVIDTGVKATDLAGAPLASPQFTGSPGCPTQPPLTDNNHLATTQYTDSAVAVETTRAEDAEAELIPLSQKGVADGVAALDSSGQVLDGSGNPVTGDGSGTVTKQTVIDTGLAASDIGGVEADTVGVAGGVAALNESGDVVDAAGDPVTGTGSSIDKQAVIDTGVLATDLGGVAEDNVGQPGGPASLDSTGHVPSSQLPAVIAGRSGMQPDAAIVEAFPVYTMANPTGGQALTSGTMQISRGDGVVPAGTQITGICVIGSTVVPAGVTHQWFALYDTNGDLLGVTADDAANGWPGTARIKRLDLTAPYTPSEDLVPVVGVVQVATTMSKLIVTGGLGSAMPDLSSIIAGMPLGGAANGGLTDPTTAPGTLTAPSGASLNSPFYFFLY